MQHLLPRILMIAALMNADAITAQGFAPFGGSDRKLFASPDRKGYSLAFDSTQQIGTAASYFNFCGVRDTLTPSNCPWWGGPECRTQDRPTWPGRAIDADTSGAHVFYNLWSEAIIVPFHTVVLDTLLMYSDANQQFRLSYDSEAQINFFGQTENVRRWTIHHNDAFNNPINSALNGAQILVGETMGLMQFFRVDSFPAVLEPLELIGHEGLALGLYRLTPAMLEDHQPGDEIQVHFWSYQSMGPPWNNYSRYQKRIFLDRIDTADDVIYTVRTEAFEEGDQTMVIDTITETYSWNDVVAALPFERFDGTQPIFEERSYCGIDLWTYETFLNQGLAYCADENCWGPYDTNGPPPQGGTSQVVGLGQYEATSTITSPNGLSTGVRVVYFKKNGIQCMNEAVVGTEERIAAPIVHLGPNPTNGLLTFRNSSTVATLTVFDETGRAVFRSQPNAAFGDVDLSSTGAGVYIMRMQFADGRSAVQRVVHR